MTDNQPEELNTDPPEAYVLDDYYSVLEYWFDADKWCGVCQKHFKWNEQVVDVDSRVTHARCLGLSEVTDLNDDPTGIYEESRWYYEKTGMSLQDAIRDPCPGCAGESYAEGDHGCQCKACKP